MSGSDSIPPSGSWRTDLWRLVNDCESELQAELEFHASKAEPGSWLHDSLTSPDPRGAVRGVLALIRSRLEPA